MTAYPTFCLLGLPHFGSSNAWIAHFHSRHWSNTYTLWLELWNSSINYTSQLAVQDIHYHHNCSHPIELADATGNGDWCCFRQEMEIAGVFQAVLWSLKESQGKSIKKKKNGVCKPLWHRLCCHRWSLRCQIRWKLFRPHLLTSLPISMCFPALVPELSSCDSSVSLPVPSQSLPSFFSAVL